MKQLVKEIRGYLSERERLQDKVLRLSRVIVRNSSRAIMAIHREDEKSANRLLQRARRDLRRLISLARKDPWLYTSGASHTAQQEYVEAVFLFSLVKWGKLVDLRATGVSYQAYLGGLADVIGELRREVLEAIRRNKVQKAEGILKLMEDVYEMLTEFDYADSITPGLRRKRDIARRILEKTRGDLILTTGQERSTRGR